MSPPGDDVPPAMPSSQPAIAAPTVANPLPPNDAETAPPRARSRGVVARLATIFTAVLALCVLGYLAFAVPGKWFTSARSLAWGPKELQVAKGSARMLGDELAVAPADASGLVVVSVKTTLKAIDYAAVEWIAIDVPDHIDVSLLWRTDVKPEQVNSIPLVVVTGRLLPVVTQNHPAWIGTIQGLALAMKGPVAEPVRIRGVVAKALSASEVMRDRTREWFAFESWTGTSINTVTGGADLQDLPLPLLLAGAVALATLVVAAIRRFRPAALPIGTFGALAAFVLVAWLLLDLRWMWNLVRQVDATADRFAGKSWVDKRLAVEDGPLFAFVQKAKEAMPSTPVRVFVAADSHYFRGRAAYHLYPHNVFYEARTNSMPPRQHVRAGDWILVFNRKGVQYDAAQNKLRWDNQEPVSAELKLAGRGSALFLVR
jgi:hypothetical protein